MDRFTRHWKRISRARGGTCSVEFVLILPLLALMLFGTIEIGRLLFDFHAASKTVRDATRYLTRIDAAALGLACPAVTVNNAAAEVTNAKNLALTGSIKDPGLPGSTPYLLGYWTDANSISVTVSCEDNSADPKPYQGFYAAADWVPSITVSATVPIPLMNGWLLGRGDTLTFTVSHKEAHFGQ